MLSAVPGSPSASPFGQTFPLPLPVPSSRQWVRSGWCWEDRRQWVLPVPPGWLAKSGAWEPRRREPRVPPVISPGRSAASRPWLVASAHGAADRPPTHHSPWSLPVVGARPLLPAGRWRLPRGQIRRQSRGPGAGLRAASRSAGREEATPRPSGWQTGGARSPVPGHSASGPGSARPGPVAWPIAPRPPPRGGRWHPSGVDRPSLRRPARKSPCWAPSPVAGECGFRSAGRAPAPASRWSRASPPAGAPAARGPASSQ